MSLRTGAWSAALALAVVLVPSSAFAFPTLEAAVPNAWTHGCITCHNNPDGGNGCASARGAGETWEETSSGTCDGVADSCGIACTETCSPTDAVTGTAPCLNPFGLQVQALVHAPPPVGAQPSLWWSMLYDLDADGDGWTNGEELGEPTGTWIGDATVDLSGARPRLTDVANDPADFFGFPGDTDPTGTVTVDLCCVPDIATSIDRCATAGYSMCDPDHGTCVDEDPTTPEYTCTCAGHFGGDHCDVCAEGYTGDDCATCADGFTDDGSGNCVDDDECDPSPCDANATCANTPGSFTCTCNDGYAGDGTTCADVDECTDGSASCPDHTTCTNQEGAPYTCECDPGFMGDPCGEICGDGMVGPSEQCDDGDTGTGDGCDDTCTIESGWSCTRNLGDDSECTETTPPMTDGGPPHWPDAGNSDHDAGTNGTDGGTSTPPTDSGCACRASQRGSSAPAWLVVAALSAIVTWRRRARR